MLNQVKPQDHPEHSFVWTDTEIDWIHNRDAKWQEFVNQSKMPERLVQLEAALARANTQVIHKGRYASEWAELAEEQDKCIIGLKSLTDKLKAAWEEERNVSAALAKLQELK